MVHLCFVWSPKHPTHSDSQGQLWIHWTHTSLNISLFSYFSEVSILHLKLWWCEDKCLIVNHAPSLISCYSCPVLFNSCCIYIASAGPLHPPLVSCLFFLFAKEVAEADKWDYVCFHRGKAKDDLVCFLIYSTNIWCFDGIPTSELVCA